MSHAKKGSGDTGNPRREGVAAYLTDQELVDLHRPDPLGVGARIALEWALIATALAVWAKLGGPVAWVLAWVVIGTRQHALINLIHDGTHYALSRRRRLNDTVMDVFCAAPVLLSTASHRIGHQPHHHHLGDAERDTEKRIWINLRGWRSLRFVLLHLSAGTMLNAIRGYLSRVETVSGPPPIRALGLVAVTQATILGGCAALGAPFAYLHLWLYPLFSVALMLVSLLAIAQHQPGSYAAAGRDDPSADLRPPLTRNAVGSPLERFLFANIGGAYHHEHHLLPGVPHTRLPGLHALLVERGFYDHLPEDTLRPSYARVLAELVRARRVRPEAAQH